MGFLICKLIFASNTSPLLYFNGWDTGFLLRVYKKVHNDIQCMIKLILFLKVNS